MAKRAVSPNAFYVYILFRHDTGQPFYVGKGHGDRWNYSAKIRQRDTNRHKRAVIHRAQNAGAEIPKVKIASNLTEAQAFEIERAFIAAIGRQHLGGPLTNLTDGGDGESGRIISAKQREIMSKARKGTKLSAEWRAKIGVGQKGRRATPETRQKMSDIQRGKKKTSGWWSSEEGRSKQQRNNRGHSGHVHSEETRIKIRAARAKQAPHSPEALAKISASSAARHHSVEARMKIKAAWIRRKAAMIEQPIA